MTRLARSRTIAAGAFALIGTAGFLAPPATADPPSVGIAPFLDRETTNDFTIQATVRHDEGTLTGQIGLTILSLDGQPPVDAPPAQAANGQASQTVRFTVPGIEYNGNYQAKVTATSVKSGLAGIGGHPPTAGSGTRDFLVLVPPVPPAGVSAVVDPDTRVVTVRWRPNPEKDLLFYVIQRAKGSGAYVVLGNSDGPADTSIVDRSTADSAGEYRYQVVAVRRGATADKGETSDPSPAATADVPGPPGPPATTPDGTPVATTPGGTGAGGTGTGGSGATPTPVAAGSPGALQKSGTIDLSGFSAIQSQARRSAPRAQAPDPGFKEALPFGSTNTTRLVGEEGASGAEPGPGGDTQVRELGAQDASNDRQRSTAFLAAGLLATVLLMHLLWIKGEVQREPLEALVPE